MPKTAFIIHGTSGFPGENWFPWLKKELEKLDYQVFIPQFPTPKNQTPKTWFEVFKEYEKFLNKESIIIGHSLGGTFLLRILEETKTPIKAAFFVSSPVGILPIKNIKTDKPFLKKPFNWSEIKKNCKKFFVFHSDNDPFVCLENGKELAKKLSIDLIFVPNSGHFNSAAGYTKFALLLEKIKGI